MGLPLLPARWKTKTGKTHNSFLLCKVTVSFQFGTDRATGDFFMTTSSQLIPKFILLKYSSHTQLLSLMSAFCYSAFLSKPIKPLHKPLSVSGTGISSFVKNIAYLGFITVPNYSAVWHIAIRLAKNLNAFTSFNHHYLTSIKR